MIFSPLDKSRSGVGRGFFGGFFWSGMCHWVRFRKRRRNLWNGRMTKGRSRV